MGVFLFVETLVICQFLRSFNIFLILMNSNKGIGSKTHFFTSRFYLIEFNRTARHFLNLNKIQSSFLDIRSSRSSLWKAQTENAKISI